MFNDSFPALNRRIQEKTLIYFDSACTSIKPQDTINEISRYYEEYSWCSWDRESSLLGSLLQEEINQWRKEVASIIGANTEDIIVFTASATDAINIVIEWTSNEIGSYVVSDLEHNSNYLPQYEKAKTAGKSFIVIPYNEMFDEEKLTHHLSKIQKPFLLSFTHASNIIGGRFDIKNISRIVHKYWWYILIDDTQFIAYNDENIEENELDFVVFSGHKMYGPTGIGILSIRKSAISLFSKSVRLWWWTIKTFDKGVPVYKPLPYLLEWWVQNFSGIFWLSGAIRWRKDRKIETIHNHVVGLSEYFVSELREKRIIENFTVISLPNSSLVTLIPNTFQSIDFHQYCNYFLEEYIIAFRTGTMCADVFTHTYLDSTKNIMRFSFGVYNTKEEVDILIHTLIDYIWLLKNSVKIS